MKHKKLIIISVCIMAYLIFIVSRYNTNTRLHANDVVEQDKRAIITSFYPMYMHVKELTKDVPIHVVNMVSSQVGCLHDYQLRVEDMKTLQTGQIFVINGLGAESFITKAYEQNTGLQVINASATLENVLEEHDHEHEKHEHEEEHDHEHEEHEHEEEHDHEHEEHEHEEEHDHEHEEHKHEEEHEHETDHDYKENHNHEESSFEEDHSGHNHTNEHIWLSLEGSIEQVKNISKGLQELDPTHSELYKRNEENYILALRALKAQIEEELKALKGRKMILVHNSFEYLAEELGIEIVGIISGEEESPTAKDVEEIIKLMKENDIQQIFTETQYKNLGIVQTIGKESKGTIYELDSLVTPIEQDTEEIEYVQRMKKNIKVLKEAYGL